MQTIIKLVLAVYILFVVKLAAESTWPMLPWDTIDWWFIIVVVIGTEYCLWKHENRHQTRYSEVGHV